MKPLRFVLWSLPLYLAWEYALREPYLSGLARLFVGLARLCGVPVAAGDVQQGTIEFAYSGVAWKDAFGMTGINVVALAALVLATGRISWRRRLRMLGIGIAALVGTQILGLWSDIVRVQLRPYPALASPAEGLRAFLTGLGTFLFPIGIWLVLVRDLLPLPASARERRAGIL